MSIDLMMPSNHVIPCHPFSSCSQYFPASGSFLMSQVFTSGSQSIGASASASVFPMNVLSSSVISDSLQTYGLQSIRFLCPLGYFRQESWSESPCPSPGDLPSSRNKPRSPTLQVDSLPIEPPGNPKNTGVGSLYLSPRDPNPGIGPRSSALQVDSLPAEPLGKPKNTGEGRLSPLQQIFLTQESNHGPCHCR